MGISLIEKNCQKIVFGSAKKPLLSNRIKNNLEDF